MNDSNIPEINFITLEENKVMNRMKIFRRKDAIR